MGENRQPSLASVLRKRASSGKTILNVDQPTFDALQLAQDTIRYVHTNTPYGAPNQVGHIYRMRDGSRTNAEAIGRFNQGMAAFFELIGVSPNEPTYQMTTRNIGIMAGITLLAGTGTCDLQASLAFAYLAKNAPLGTTLELTELKAIIESSEPNTGTVTSLNHFCLKISWNGCENEVICDPWPTRSQACRQSEYFGTSFNQRSALIAKYGLDPMERPEYRARLDEPWRRVNTYTITPENVGRDLVHEAFGMVDASALPSFSTPIPPSEEEIIHFDRTLLIVHRRSALADHLPPDVHYHNSGCEITSSSPLPDGPRLPAHVSSAFGTAKQASFKQGPLPSAIQASGSPSTGQAEGRGQRHWQGIGH